MSELSAEFKSHISASPNPNPRYYFFSRQRIDKEDFVTENGIRIYIKHGRLEFLLYDQTILGSDVGGLRLTGFFTMLYEVELPDSETYSHFKMRSYFSAKLGGKASSMSFILMLSLF